MASAKYRFHELKRSKGQLPEDVNAFVEETAAKFNDEKLSSMLRMVREKKLYGSAVHYNEQGAPVAEFDYQHGICPRFKLVEYHGSRNAFVRSVHNDRVDMSKKEKQ